jgi:hypothetical protein
VKKNLTIYFGINYFIYIWDTDMIWMIALRLSGLFPHYPSSAVDARCRLHRHRDMRSLDNENGSRLRVCRIINHWVGELSLSFGVFWYIKSPFQTHLLLVFDFLLVGDMVLTLRA